jgi:integration host factor subunit alpha
MADKTITRTDVSNAVYQKVGLSRTQAAEILERVLGEIRDTLVRGEDVKLSGFGKFLVRNKAERLGRNPKTGFEVQLEERRILMSKPSQPQSSYGR